MQQLEDMLQSIYTPQRHTFEVYAKGAKLFLSKVSLEVLQNWVSIQLLDTPHIFAKVQGLIKELFQLIYAFGTGEYLV